MTWLCCRWWLCPSRHFSPLLVTQGGRGAGDTNCKPVSPETQPLARRVGWGLGEGWLGSGRGLAGVWERVGWGLGEGWLGSGKRVGWGLGVLQRKEHVQI